MILTPFCEFGMQDLRSDHPAHWKTLCCTAHRVAGPFLPCCVACVKITATKWVSALSMNTFLIVHPYVLLFLFSPCTFGLYSKRSAQVPMSACSQASALLNPSVKASCLCIQNNDSHLWYRPS